MSIEAPIAKSDNWFIGEDKIFEFTVVDSDGDIQDISGWSLEWVLRQRPDRDAAVLTKTDEDGIELTSPASGICQVTITDANTLALSPGSYYHTLRRDDDDSETVLSFGEAILRQAATR